jgi:hypothetical protein
MYIHIYLLARVGEAPAPHIYLLARVGEAPAPRSAAAPQAHHHLFLPCVNNLYRTTWPRRKNLAMVCYSRSHSPIQIVGTCSLSLNLAATTPCITQSPPRRARRRAEVPCRARRRVICHRGERTDVLAGGLAALVAVSRGPCHARSCFFRRALPR